MFSRYVFYEDKKNKKELKVWSFSQSHEEYLKSHNILQSKDGTEWKKIISMGYLKLDIEKENLYIVALLNKDERYVQLYLQQIKSLLEDLYPHTPKMKNIIHQDASAVIVKKKVSSGKER